MKLNILKLSHLVTPAFRTLAPRTYEGGPTVVLSPEQMLRRSVMTCMRWEKEFYETGESIASRIRTLVPQVEARVVASLAIEARTKMKLRHAPLLLVREMARHSTHRALVAETLQAVVQRADELTEFVALYWAQGKTPLSAQVKKGLASAFTRFDEYALAKYDRAGAVRLRDVLFLSHAKPTDAAQAALWKRLVDGELTIPDTWEVALSGGGDKHEQWTRLLRERKLGTLALLRNLRNMKTAKVDDSLIIAALDAARTDRVLPFRFLAAARHVPQFEVELERAMFRSLETEERLPGRTAVLVDVSGSMVCRLSHRSEMLRTDAAYGVAMLLREVAEKVDVFTFSNDLKQVPPRRGFALRDAMETSQGHSGTQLGKALREVRDGYDRVVVITNEQSADRVDAPASRCYMINVASAKYSVGYGNWTRIDGFSESVISYIQSNEAVT